MYDPSANQKDGDELYPISIIALIIGFGAVAFRTSFIAAFGNFVIAMVIQTIFMLFLQIHTRDFATTKVLTAAINLVCAFLLIMYAISNGKVFDMS